MDRHLRNTWRRAKHNGGTSHRAFLTTFHYTILTGVYAAADIIARRVYLIHLLRMLRAPTRPDAPSRLGYNMDALCALPHELLPRRLPRCRVVLTLCCDVYTLPTELTFLSALTRLTGARPAAHAISHASSRTAFRRNSRLSSLTIHRCARRANALTAPLFFNMRHVW